MMRGRKFLNITVAVAAILAAGVSSCLLGACGNSNKPTGAALPDKFPIACYPGSECTRSDSTPIGNNKYRQIVVLKSNDEFDKICSYYKQEIGFKNFQLLSDNNRRGTVTLEAKSADAKLDIVLVPVDVSTIISISYDPKLDVK
jgi:hypothetical protein